MHEYGCNDSKSSSMFRNPLSFTIVSWFSALATFKWLRGLIHKELDKNSLHSMLLWNEITSWK